MFYFDGMIYKSDFLDSEKIGHGFSTRIGGVSTEPHTKTMSLSFGLGDSDETVRENMKILCLRAEILYDGLVGSAQHHTTLVRTVKRENALEGIEKENLTPTDGFVTDEEGMSLIVRGADCTPILFCGEKEDKSPVIGACHAGWKGAVGGIASNTVNGMVKLGAVKKTVKAALGQCIHSCHFEVKEDFVEAVRTVAGNEFASLFIKPREGRLYADLVGMNVRMLLEGGLSEENIDISPECTVCNPDLFHSHRATGGKRGTMGGVIGIKY